MQRATILVMIDYYLPGFKAGGPLRTLANLVSRFSDEFRFQIITRDRDLGDSEPYGGVPTGCWVSSNGAEVLYLTPDQLSFRAICRIMQQTPHDMVYLNGLFSVPFSITPLFGVRAKRVPRQPIVLAPRGEMAPSALKKSVWRKRVYLSSARVTRMFDGVTWQASSKYEARDIYRKFPHADIAVVPDAMAPPEASPTMIRKNPGRAEVAFLSRIHPVKNLDFAIECLAEVREPIVFNIFGPIEDRRYWQRCQDAGRRLPPNIIMNHHGPVAPDKVRLTLSRHDALFLPTRGENFGHVILEALLAGVPVLTSDQTPWRGLANSGIGWDIPLTNRAGFVAALQQIAVMGIDSRRQYAERCWSFGERISNDEGTQEQTRQLFLRAIQGRQPAKNEWCLHSM